MRWSGKSVFGALFSAALFLLACGWGKALECLPLSEGAARAHWAPPGMEDQCFSIGLTPEYRLSYLSRPEEIADFTFGFDKFVADLLFINMLGSTSWEEKTGPFLDWIYKTGVAVTTLHPLYPFPYYAFGTYLSFYKERIADSNDIFSRGAEALPYDFNMPFMIAYNYYWQLDQKAEAGPYFAEACRRPGAPPQMCSLAGRLMLEGRTDPIAVAGIIVQGYCINAAAERAKIIRHDFKERVLPLVEDSDRREKLLAWFEKQIEGCTARFEGRPPAEGPVP